MVKRPILAAAMDLNAISQSIYGVREAEIKEQENELCLIGTAEHAILGMHAGETLPAEELPKKYLGYSMCFRQEIGSHGVNEKGLWRTHQFNKVEQFIFCTPEQSWAAYEELKHNSELILDGLQLPYRIIEICTGDLALWKAKSHDFEVWRPTTQSYGEVMSLSNCTVFQSTDLDMRYVTKTGERGYMHTLNNTALATSRIMVAILENCQEADGTVIIPEVLRPYMHGKSKIVKQ
jgi:seryl-tRNA synthetase